MVSKSSYILLKIMGRNILRSMIFFAPLFPLLAFGDSPNPALSEPVEGVEASSVAEIKSDDYLNLILDRADKKGLDRSRTWQLLLHYKPSLIGGGSSQIDDPRFFLSPDGKRDPKAELQATVASFFRPPKEGDEHPICRFPARFAWLKEELSLEEGLLPNPVCAEYDKIYKTIDPQRAVLIFPSAHLNSPASMFGHTLLRLDSGLESSLVSQAVNYAAITDTTNGFTYAFKGIFGFYKGYFSLLPYYEKVTEYNDLELRDMWEYRLDLSQQELTRLFMHIWELKDIYSNYYFFDENCSYNLLFLLEAARPSLNLTEEFSSWVIPVDTVRVVKNGGIVTESLYRPSQATRIRRIAERLEGKQQDLALEVIYGKLDPQELAQREDSAERRALILDLSAEYLQYLAAEKKLTPEEYQTRFVTVLRQRSLLGKAAPVAATRPAFPDEGHGSNRFTLGIGVKDHAVFQEIGYRPAYHTLLDPQQGYLTGSQLEFGSIYLRYYYPFHRVQLEKFDLINIVSLSPRDRFFKPTSWKVVTGLYQEMFPDETDHLVYQLSTGGGFSRDLGFGLGYFLGETEALLSDRLDDKYSIGLGGSVGFLYNPAPFWSGNFSLRKLYYPLGDSHQTLEAAIAQSLHVNRNNSIELSLARRKTFDVTYSEGTLSWKFFW